MSRREAKDNPSLAALNKELRPQCGRTQRDGVGLVHILKKAFRALI